jgi:hypothetical protein
MAEYMHTSYTRYYRFHAPFEPPTYELANTNLLNEWNNMPQRYLALFKSTERFISTVHQLYRLPNTFQQASIMLIEFSSGVLRAPNSCFSRMLNSQRISIYALLDTALSEILLHEWEDEEQEGADNWSTHTQPLRHAISDQSLLFEKWANEDMKDLVFSKLSGEGFASDGTWMSAIYFEKSKRLLHESMDVYGLRKRINMLVQGRLPMEVVDEIVKLVSVEEGIPTQTLGSRFSLKGKGKEVNVIEGTTNWYFEEEVHFPVKPGVSL